MDREIRRAASTELADPAFLPAIASLLAESIRELRAAGIDQWDEAYPTLDLFERDCREGNLFVVRDENGSLIGCASLDRRQAPEYASVDWFYTGEPIGAAHRMMIASKHGGKGYAKAMMRALEAEAHQRAYRCLRLDAFLNNPCAMKIYPALGYRRAGEVQFRKGTFACFEKRVGTLD